MEYIGLRNISLLKKRKERKNYVAKKDGRTIGRWERNKHP